MKFGPMLLLFFLAMARCASAQSGDRVALVIGNAAYEHTSPLRNPVNDANAMAETLGGLGYDVTTLTNAKYQEIWVALRDFARRAAGADTAVVFYSGHGIAFEGKNYILPIGAKFYDESDVIFNAIPLYSLRASASEARELSVVILDASRDNPFASPALISSRGLSRVESRAGEVVAFSNAPGAISEDSDGHYSTFTEAFIEHLRVSPDQDVRVLFPTLQLSMATQIPYVQMGPLPETKVAFANSIAQTEQWQKPLFDSSSRPPLSTDKPHIANDDPTPEEIATAESAQGPGLSKSPYDCQVYYGKPGVMFAGRCWPLETTKIDINDTGLAAPDQITDIAPLAYLEHLRLLSVIGAEVTDLSPLSRIPRLHYLAAPDGSEHGGDEETPEARAAVFTALRTWGEHAAQE